MTWYPEGGYWVMTTVVADEQVVKLHRSDDLLQWDLLSDFRAASGPGVLWEMPELVRVPVEGQPGRREWVMLLSVNPGGIAGGSRFALLHGHLRRHHVHRHRRAWDRRDAREPDLARPRAGLLRGDLGVGRPGERPVVVGWMSNWAYAADVPTAPWRGSMAIPRELSLHESPAGLVLGNRPAAPVEGAAGRPQQVLEHAEVDGRLELAALDGGTAHWVSATVRPGDSATAAVQLFGRDGREGARVSYDATAQELVVERAGSGSRRLHRPLQHAPPGCPSPSKGGELRLDVLVDRGSVEVFVDGGVISVTTLALPEVGATGLALLSEGGASRFEDVQVRPLGS